MRRVVCREFAPIDRLVSEEGPDPIPEAGEVLVRVRAAGVNYESEDLKTRVREIAGGGVDVVVDPVGGTQAEPALRTLRPFGRYLVVGFASGSIPSLRANLILLTNRSAIGVDWGAWSMQNHDDNSLLLDEVLRLAGSGALRPTEPAAYPLARAAEALADLQGRRVAGKVVLVPD